MVTRRRRVEASLAKHAFFPGTSLEMQTQGWASPRDNGQLVHTVGRQMLLTLRTEKKLLPATVVNQVTKRAPPRSRSSRATSPAASRSRN